MSTVTQNTNRFVATSLMAMLLFASVVGNLAQWVNTGILKDQLWEAQLLVSAIEYNGPYRMLTKGKSCPVCLYYPHKAGCELHQFLKDAELRD